MTDWRGHAVILAPSAPAPILGRAWFASALATVAVVAVSAVVRAAPTPKVSAVVLVAATAVGMPTPRRARRPGRAGVGDEVDDEACLCDVSRGVRCGQRARRSWMVVRPSGRSRRLLCHVLVSFRQRRCRRRSGSLDGRSNRARGLFRRRRHCRLNGYPSDSRAAGGERTLLSPNEPLGGAARTSWLRGHHRRGVGIRHCGRSHRSG